MNFVSESELRKKREEGGEEEAESSEPLDKRPLYERLKEVRDKKQLEYDETHALKNQFRGIDEGEADFLIQVDRAKEEQEARKRKEEFELVKLTKQTNVAGSSSSSAIEQLPLVLERPQKAPKNNKQASLISSLVRKRPRSDSNEGEATAEKAVAAKEAKTDPEEATAPKQLSLERETHCQQIGFLPGIAGYSDSSDEAESSSNSESLESELPIVAVYAGKGAQKKNCGEN